MGHGGKRLEVGIFPGAENLDSVDCSLGLYLPGLPGKPQYNPSLGQVQSEAYRNALGTCMLQQRLQIGSRGRGQIHFGSLTPAYNLFNSYM